MSIASFVEIHRIPRKHRKVPFFEATTVAVDGSEIRRSLVDMVNIP